MATKIKGIYKGFKFISQIFVAKERELEIGYPTDVKHVSHIGWDHQSGRAPSWMNEFKTGPEFSSASIGNSCFGALSPLPSLDFSESMRQQDLTNIPKKQRRKKGKSNSSSRAVSSSRSARQAHPKSKLSEENTKSSDVERCHYINDMS